MKVILINSKKQKVDEISIVDDNDFYKIIKSDQLNYKQIDSKNIVVFSTSHKDARYYFRCLGIISELLPENGIIVGVDGNGDICDTTILKNDIRLFFIEQYQGGEH